VKRNSDENEIAIATTDYVASAAKATVGAVPFVGSLLVEIAGTIIPNQRIDRIAKFASCLESRLKNLESTYCKAQLENEEFTDLMEEGLRQASRSLSDARRDYIASLVSESLSVSDIDYLESKHLLRILGELNDIEIIWLRFHLVSGMGGDMEFREIHKPILNVERATETSPPSVVDKEALQDSYSEHLAQLGLLRSQYQTDLHTNQPEFDTFSRTFTVAEYELTALGNLLLKQIGLTDDDNAL